MTQQLITIEKAQVTVVPPGLGAKLALLGAQDQPAFGLPSVARREQMRVYYEMYRQHPWVRAAIEKIAKVAVANGFAFIPEDAEAQLNKDEAKQLRAFFRSSNAAQLFRATYKDLLIFGEAYWWIDKPLSGKPKQVKRLHPRFVDPLFLPDGSGIRGWRYGSISNDDKDAVDYAAEFVIQFKIDDPNNDIFGLSPLYSLQRTVAQDIFAMEFNSAFFKNSAQTGIIFNLKGTSEAEVKRSRQWLEENYTGAQNAHRPLLLEGDVEVHKSVATRAEMEFIKGREILRDEILGVLDVPHEKVGVTATSNRSTGKESDNSFRSESIAPLQLVVEEGVNNVIILAGFGWDDILFIHNEVDKRSEMDQMTILSQAEAMGIMKVNEIRSRLGLGAVEGGDEAFIQTAAGLIPLSQLVEMGQLQIQTMQAAIEASKAGVVAAKLNPPKNPDSKGIGTKHAAENPDPFGKPAALE